MKKLLVFMLCIMIVCALPTIVFAEGENTDSVGTSAVVTEDLPSTTEVVTESQISTTETTPETEPPDTEAAPLPDADASDTGEKTTAEKIVDYVITHLEEISVIITLILTVFYQVRKHGVLNKTIGTLNNNAITVAENSNTAIQEALSGVSGVSTVVSGFTEQIATLLAEVRKNAEEKESLEAKLTEVTDYLKTAKLANVELANEVAELLVLANIPNSKKEELYSRHRAAVEAIASAEKTEVTADDGQEA